MSLQHDIESMVKSIELELYDTVVVSENDETIYRVSIMSPEVIDGKRKGVSLDTCVEVTHLISPLLDVTSPVSGEYRLEVGTAGIERKLVNINHFKKSIGEKTAIVYNGKEKFRGILQSVSGTIITLANQDEEIQVEYNDITKAKTYFEW